MNVKPSHAVAALILAVAAVGFFVGTRGTRKTTEERQATVYARATEKGERARHAIATNATAWPDLPEVRRGPNATFVNSLDTVVGTTPAPETLEGRDARLIEARVTRAARRAYDGAPPRIPHAIDQRTSASCLACHEDGLVIADHVAPKMSHPVYNNCTQCHVRDGETGVEAANFPAEYPTGRVHPPENTFVGLAPHSGQRFLPDSPPVMPHSLTNRQECTSCHGPLGTPGLRTTHPERRNCEQCHAPGPSVIQEIFFR